MPSTSGADILAKSSYETRSRLLRLQAERFEALRAGVDPGGVYMGYLMRAIGEARAECVTAAVTEIAALRGDLAGRLDG